MMVRGVPEVFAVFIIRFLNSIECALLKTAIWKITGSISQILLKGNEVMNVRNAVGKTKYEINQKIHLTQKVCILIVPCNQVINKILQTREARH